MKNIDSAPQQINNKNHTIVKITLIIILFMLILYITYVPLKIYLEMFPGTLSKEKDTWSAFGTYIGGVYGPIFTLFSVIIYALTLFEINRTNTKTIKSNTFQNTTSEVLNLAKSMSSMIENKKAIKGDRNYFFEWIGSSTKTYFSSNGSPSSEDEINVIASNKFKEDERDLFRDELVILKMIISLVESADDSQNKERLKLAFMAIIPNRERYWLERFALRFDGDAYSELINWKDFSSMPNDLYRLIVMPDE